MWVKVMSPDKTTKESKLCKNGHKTVTIVILIQNKSQNIQVEKLQPPAQVTDNG
jgi:hypothetical protein